MKACLVVHGLTGTPATVASLSVKLAAHGFNVVTPRLAGHDTLKNLERVTWQEWYQSVLDAYQSLRQETDQISYAGISLGALLGLHLAANEGKELRALALLSTPFHLNFLNTFLIYLVRYTPLRFLITSVAKDPLRSVADPEGRKFYMEHSLKRIPAHATYELIDLQRKIREELPHIKNPLLLVHADHDQVSPSSNVRIIKKLCGSQHIEIARFPRSHHVMTLDFEKELAANATLEFFNRFTSAIHVPTTR
ncbi:MAG: hypothetical protein A3I05_02745 [Deltaproteobacteria bacterium RIFCSPLOWO2_02_FULL_44_10]|nr:MAG: hypothetical protein A3C46_03410 [Deltaproteobacteria bacterium RIFCSPHIGHO2_02_FULL_44_16]OGQ46535.1 MAG: hypothetical protein A3I05_02745 [Deltaproteobacteria bacterium RIFCSPLOWO2_02_FULL_44_10]